MFNRVVDGIDVFEVGKEQLWGWCHHQARYVGLRPVIYSGADSLRKGLYVVVEHSAMFGVMECMSHICFSFSSLKKAVQYVQNQSDVERYGAEKWNGRILSDFEIWHIVDDYVLWYDWDSLAGQNAQGVDPCGTYPCGCCGSGGERGCEFYESNIFAQPLKSGVVCDMCGDDFYGPWELVGKRYLCESCLYTIHLLECC